MLARAESAAVERLSKGEFPNLALCCADEDADIKQVTVLIYTYVCLEANISALLLQESRPRGFSKRIGRFGARMECFDASLHTACLS